MLALMESSGTQGAIVLRGWVSRLDSAPRRTGWLRPRIVGRWWALRRRSDVRQRAYV